MEFWGTKKTLHLDLFIPYFLVGQLKHIFLVLIKVGFLIDYFVFSRTKKIKTLKNNERKYLNLLNLFENYLEFCVFLIILWKVWPDPKFWWISIVNQATLLNDLWTFGIKSSLSIFCSHFCLSCLIFSAFYYFHVSWLNLNISLNLSI